jgi:hypothetical protein
MTAWMQPSEHITKAQEYISKADDMAAAGGVNAETIPRLSMLAGLAQVHVDLAMVKRSG